MKLVIYKTKLGPQRGYRWRLVADNSKVLANGGQGYIEKAIGGWHTVAGHFARAQGGEVTERIPVEDRTRGTR